VVGAGWAQAAAARSVEEKIQRAGEGGHREEHTSDGSRAAHVEHAAAIITNGPRILTLP
jgi:hypothetical protein